MNGGGSGRIKIMNRDDAKSILLQRYLFLPLLGVEVDPLEQRRWIQMIQRGILLQRYLFLPLLWVEVDPLEQRRWIQMMQRAYSYKDICS